MGFFGSLGKVLAGKPVYEPENQSAQPATKPGQVNGNRPVPVVRIGRIENQVSGQRLDTYADIRNESAEPIFLDYILLCGAKRELDAQLGPGEVRQMLIYAGPLLARQPGGYAEVHYRTASDGNYFADYHEIRSRQEGNQGYIITELLLRGPVKDI